MQAKEPKVRLLVWEGMARNATNIDRVEVTFLKEEESHECANKWLKMILLVLNMHNFFY